MTTKVRINRSFFQGPDELPQAVTFEGHQYALSWLGKGSSKEAYLGTSAEKTNLVVFRSRTPLQHEVQVLQDCQTIPGVVKLLFPRETNSNKSNIQEMYTEYCEGGDFLQWSRNQPLAMKLRVLRDVAQALQALHAKRVAHGDIKPQNIAIDGSGSGKLIDFSSAVTGFLFDQPRDIRGSTLGYFPMRSSMQLPSFTGNFPKDVDWYAFGVCVFNVLQGMISWNGEYGNHFQKILVSKNPYASEFLFSIVGSIDLDWIRQEISELSGHFSHQLTVSPLLTACLLPSSSQESETSIADSMEQLVREAEGLQGVARCVPEHKSPSLEKDPLSVDSNESL